MTLTLKDGDNPVTFYAALIVWLATRRANTREGGAVEPPRYPEYLCCHAGIPDVPRVK